jgi:hypothetical protein
MAQTESPPIKGAFFGILVLFGVFVLGAWFFDRFTGHGFNAQEPVLKIAVYSPAVPESRWGDASHGLKAKLSFGRADPSQFVDSTIDIQYENITNSDITLLCDPNEILKAVYAVNSDNWRLGLTAVPREIFLNDAEYDKAYKPTVHTIKPGEILKKQVQCQIVNVIKNGGFMPGFFDVTYTQEIDENKVSQYQADSGKALWTGKIKAGECKIYLTMPHDGGCNDCHGDADYHHGVLQDCRFCHAEGTAIMHDTCIRCHKQDEQKIYGRRRVMGPEGDFDNISRHISGIIKDSDCLVCHDMTKHGYGTVILADPNSPGQRTFTDEYTEFCLSCHNSKPPEGVKFPDKSAKTDKAKPVDYSNLLEKYGDSEDKSDHAESSSPFSGLSSFSGLKSSTGNDSGSEDDNGYPEVALTPEESSGYKGVESMMTEPTSDSEGKIHSDTGVSIYDKSDFRNSELYKKKVDCTDCHRSHGSDRPSLLKNVHGPDDKVRI